MKKLNILFLCTGNSCRSQMAEGLAKAIHPNINFYSAGIEKHGLNPNAVLVMKETDIDISKHTSNTLDEFVDITFDYVITVCSNANETCPVFSNNKTKVIHYGFDDPPKLALRKEDDKEKLNCYRIVRDQIKNFIISLDDFLIDK